MRTVTIEHSSEAGQQIRGIGAWQDFVKTNFPVSEVPDGNDGEFRANVKLRWFGDRSLFMINADDYRMIRTGHGVRTDEARYIAVMWLRDGTMSVEQDGRSSRLVAGMASICDTGRPYRHWMSHDVRKVMLFLPYTAIPGWEQLSQKVCGIALAVAPIGAWIAQSGRIDVAPLVLAAGVICWVAGFDLIYATQDYDFDRREGIRSLVVKLGIVRSLRLAQLLHLITFVALIAFGLVARLGPLYYWSMPLIAVALVYEHKIDKLNVAGINRAFFQSNVFVSAVFLVAVCADRLIR